MKFKQIRTRSIVNTSLILSLLLIAKVLEVALPDLPAGLGEYIPLFDFIIILSILVFSKWEVLTASLIYLLAIVWLGPSIFISGILWVDTLKVKLFVYMLDYFLPCIFLISIAFFIKSKTGFWKTYMLIITSIFAMYLSHVLSGVLFWSSYAWSGWGPIAYSVVANGPKLLIMCAMSLPILKIGYAIRKSIVRGNVYG